MLATSGIVNQQSLSLDLLPYLVTQGATQHFPVVSIHIASKCPTRLQNKWKPLSRVFSLLDLFFLCHDSHGCISYITVCILPGGPNWQQQFSCCVVTASAQSSPSRACYIFLFFMPECPTAYCKLLLNSLMTHSGHTTMIPSCFWIKLLENWGSRCCGTRGTIMFRWMC